jgi:hypothetical protein
MVTAGFLSAAQESLAQASSNKVTFEIVEKGWPPLGTNEYGFPVGFLQAGGDLIWGTGRFARPDEVRREIRYALTNLHCRSIVWAVQIPTENQTSAQTIFSFMDEMRTLFREETAVASNMDVRIIFKPEHPVQRKSIIDSMSEWTNDPAWRLNWQLPESKIRESQPAAGDDRLEDKAKSQR